MSVPIVVKLTRVLLLAPVVAAVGVGRRRRVRSETDRSIDSKLPPFVPVFVLGFLACVMFRSIGTFPASVLSLI